MSDVAAMNAPSNDSDNPVVQVVRRSHRGMRGRAAPGTSVSGPGSPLWRGPLGPGSPLWRGPLGPPGDSISFVVSIVLCFAVAIRRSVRLRLPRTGTPAVAPGAAE